MKYICFSGLVFVVLCSNALALTLEQCIEAAKSNNPVFEQYLQEENKSQAAKIQSRSRLLPQLSLVGNWDDYYRETGTKLDSNYYSLRLKVSQRLWEFGPDNIEDISVREYMRTTKMQRIEVSRQIERDLRIAFRSAKIRQEQLQEQRVLLTEFEQALNRAQDRLSAGKNTEADVFTVELSVLAEQERIVELEMMRSVWLARLERLTGTVIDTNSNLTEIEPNSSILTMKEAINLVAETDPGFEYYEGLISEANRQLREEVWQWVPSFSIAAGVRNEDYRANITTSRFINSVGDTLGTWSMDLNLEKDLKRSNNYPDLYPVLFPDATSYIMPQLRAGQKDSYALLSLDWDLFDGLESVGTYKEARANQKAAIAEYEAYKDRIILALKQAFSIYQQQLQKQEYSRRRAEIARKRLEIKTTLREFGRITDEELEYFRQLYFQAENEYFTAEEELIQAEEEYRYYLLPGWE